MNTIEPFLNVVIGIGLLIFLVVVVYAWFAGFIGFTIHYLALRKYLVPDYSRWKDLPFWQAFFVGPSAIVFHPEYVTDEGQVHVEKAKKYGRMLLIAIAATAFAAIVKFIFFGFEPNA